MIKQRSESGFTLLEVIIALVVLSMALLPLFSLFSTHLDSMRRMADKNEKVAATSVILNAMETINPAESPEGEADMLTYSYSWTSKPLLELEKVTKGNFAVGLYETEISVMKPAQKPWFDMKLRLAGYEKAEKGQKYGS